MLNENEVGQAVFDGSVKGVWVRVSGLILADPGNGRSYSCDLAHVAEHSPHAFEVVLNGHEVRQATLDGRIDVGLEMENALLTMPMVIGGILKCSQRF